MASQQRRAQLIEAGVDVVAAAGFGALTLDSVAARAGVTRNLIYHYFPRGRADLILAVVDRAGQELTRDWLTDSEVPLPDRLAQNFARFIEHAFEPSRIWLVHRHGRMLGDPEVQALAERYRGVVVAAVAQNHFGTADPGPAASAALRSYLDFGERLLDEWRERGLEPAAVYRPLAETLLAVVDAVTGD